MRSIRVGACFSLGVLIAGTAWAAALPPPVDVTTWDLESWRAWPHEIEILSTRIAPLQFAGGNDWVHVGDSWVAASEANEEDTASATALSYDLEITDFYVTGGGNENGPNRIFCASAVPQNGEGPFPVLFVFHGGGGHASGALALGIARMNPGFAAVAVDYNGQFRPVDAPVTQWVTQTEETRERRHDLDPNPLNFPMYHNVQATRRVLDWTEAQPWSDGEHFGAVGISYGGWVSFFLAGVDERITSVLTHVSAAGTKGMRGRSCQALDWPPEEQVSIWQEHADPIVYAPRHDVPVFMKLAANDRFFWLDGAANHRDRFPHKGQWALIPNSDHGNGGPDFPDPSGLWHQAVYFGGTPFPSYGTISWARDGRDVRVPIQAERPLKSVHLAWSVGDPVSPARYWRWIEAEEKGGVWSAPLPEGHERFEGHIYFTAIDIDGRIVSSDLVRKPGSALEEAMTWERGALWDMAMGPAAWRSDLSFDKSTIQSAGEGRVRFVPLKAGRRAVLLTNSFIVPEKARTPHRGIRIELSGNGESYATRVVLARDYMSLDQQLYAAEVEVPKESDVIDLTWDQFEPYGGGTSEPHPGSINGLVLDTESLPEGGLTVGPIGWMDE
ncbi:alpha/beta hydrolase family protein [Kiritimatiella glycovorans]|uniref:Xaa-Pro dipeptidyl-peptidase-like domain-containing protein n=1 Tax=Kiritimatiella glycovorans TaxID=1307763 RepID=A0A0G3EGD5_9BACT|nr:CocE/NonD family hydrolase [Kiritimatiella glycovorans]AKJ64472.1 hypothetical protein L21SP4_01224 [Kiritimatiella glycovorans]